MIVEQSKTKTATKYSVEVQTQEEQYACTIMAYQYKYGVRYAIKINNRKIQKVTATYLADKFPVTFSILKDSIGIRKYNNI